jgi:hypothetical protein
MRSTEKKSFNFAVVAKTAFKHSQSAANFRFYIANFLRNILVSHTVVRMFLLWLDPFGKCSQFFYPPIYIHSLDFYYNELPQIADNKDVCENNFKIFRMLYRMIPLAVRRMHYTMQLNPSALKSDFPRHSGIAAIYRINRRTRITLIACSFTSKF